MLSSASIFSHTNEIESSSLELFGSSHELSISYSYYIYILSCSNLNRVKPSDGKAVVKLLGSYDPKNVKVIEDPYYVSI